MRLQNSHSSGFDEAEAGLVTILGGATDGMVHVEGTYEVCGAVSGEVYAFVPNDELEDVALTGCMLEEAGLTRNSMQ